MKWINENKKTFWGGITVVFGAILVVLKTIDMSIEFYAEHLRSEPSAIEKTAPERYEVREINKEIKNSSIAKITPQ